MLEQKGGENKKDFKEGFAVKRNPNMLKRTKTFIATIGLALVGNAILSLKPIVEAVSSTNAPIIGKLLPFIGLILGGVIGYVASTRN